MGKRWLPAWGLASVAFGGSSLIVPLYVVALGGDAFELGVLFATASFVGVPGALVFGNLADRTGKRRIFVLASMATTVTTVLAIPLLESIPLVVVANAVLWLGFAAAVPVLTLLIVTGEPENEWSSRIALLSKFQGVGWALGLALGLVVITGGGLVTDPVTAQRVFFVACAICAGGGFTLGVRTLPPDPKPGDEPAPRRLRRRLRETTRLQVRGAAFPFTTPWFDARRLTPRRLADRFSRELATYFGAVFLFFTGFGIFFAPLPAYLAGVGYTSSEIFGLYLALNVAAAVFFGRAATLVNTYDLSRVQVGALLVRGTAFPAVAAVGVLLGKSPIGIALVTAVFVIIGATWAAVAVTTATLVSKLAPPVVRGEALGVYGALVAVGGGVGGLLGGWLAGLDYTLAFVVAGVLVVTGAALVCFLDRRIQPTVPADSVVASTPDP